MPETLVMAWAVAMPRCGWRVTWAAVALIAAGCVAPASPSSAPAATDSQPIGQPTGTPGASAVSGVPQVRCSKEQPPTPTGEPDFSLFGFPQVAAKARFTPGTVMTIAAGGLALELPADLYTSPLDFELLTGDVAVWQPCVEADQLVIAPYAYRVTDPATGQRVGRFDKPVQVAVTDPRLTAPVAYWITSAENPARVRAAANPPVEGTTIRVENGSARLGWFTTVPRR